MLLERSQILTYSPTVSQLAHGKNGWTVATSGGLIQQRAITNPAEVVWEVRIDPASDRDRAVHRVRVLLPWAAAQSVVVLVGNRVLCLSAWTGDVRWEYLAPTQFAFLLVCPIAATINEDGLVVVFDNGTVMRWDQEGQCQRMVHIAEPYRAMVTSDRHEAVATDGFRIFRYATNRHEATPILHSAEKIFGLAANSCGRLVYRTLHEVVQMQGDRIHARHVAGLGLPLVAMNEFGDVAYGEGEYVLILDANGSLRARAQSPGEALASLAWSLDGMSLALGTRDGRFEVVSLADL